MRTKILQVILLGLVCSLSWGFLEEELPLSIVTTTPTELMESEEVISVSGQQAITVVFSRPVIALGSDFAKETLPADKVPFSFSINTNTNTHTTETSGSSTTVRSTSRSVSRSANEIEGSFRWVTTYIARWDPKGEWPPDWEIDLVWNQKLTTWDDVPLNLTDIPSKVTLRTPTLSLEITDVDSEIAKNLTDDEWGPYSTADSEEIGEPEVPPDGVITVSFNYPVNLTMLNGSFVVTQDGVESDISVLVFPCITPFNTFMEVVPDSTCAKLTLSGDLDVMGKYALSLPEGVKYHPLAGPLRNSFEDEFYGLKEFRVPFQRQGQLAENLRQASRRGLEYRRFDLWLVHGLSEDNTVDDIKQLITLQKVPFQFDGTIGSDAEQMDFELEFINKGRLQLTAQVEPSTKYAISMQESVDVKDGYGLPLKLPLYLDDEFDDFMLFNMQQLDSLFSTFSPGSPVFEKIEGVDYEWPLFSRKVEDGSRRISAWSITEENLMDALIGMHTYDGERSRNLTDYLGEADSVLFANTDPLSLNISDIGADQLFGDSGVFVTQECCFRRYFQGRRQIDSDDPQTIFKTNLNHVYINFGDQAYIFVTDMKTGEPLQNISVKLYSLQYQEKGKQPELLAEAMSDKTGFALLNLTEFMAGYDDLKDPWYITYVAVFQMEDGSIFFQTVTSPDGQFIDSSVQVNMVKDRQLVRPGETLKIKGYVRNSEGAEFSIPEKLVVTGQVSPSFSQDESSDYYYSYVEDPEDPLQNFEGVADQEFGSFVMDIFVPEDARLQEYSVDIYVNGESEAVEFFTVADPRPPTATLDVEVPDWVKPNGTVDVEVQAASLIGATVEAEMTITWTIEDIEGVDKITTDASGSGLYQLDLSQYGNISVPDSLSVSVEWIGPTRERITTDVSVPIQLSDKQVQLSASLPTNVPGIEFEIQATLTGPDSNETTLIIYTKNITDEKLMYDGMLDEDFIQYTDFISTEFDLQESDVIFEVMGDECGMGEGCMYALPDVGQYMIAACFWEEDDLVCKGMYRGKTLEQWTEKPLSQHFDISIDEKYSDGDDTATFTIHVPYNNVQAMIIWGNQLETKKQLQSVDIGVQTIEIPVGDECVGRCEVNVVLTIPRQSMDTVQPVAIPISVLFDPAAPHTVFLKSSLTKTVTPTDLKVEVSVEEDVIEPGQNTTISVQVYNCNIDGSECTEPSSDAEVTVIAVDKSILEALPYSPMLSKFFFDLMQYSTLYSIDELIAPDAIQAALAFIKQLNDIDPFVPLTFDISAFEGRWSSTPFDGTIEEYLARYKSDLTAFGSNQEPFNDLFYYDYQPRMMASRADGVVASAQPMMFFELLLEEVQAESLSVASSPPPSAKALSNGGGDAGGAQAVSVRVEDDFVTTPLFSVFKTQADGTGEATFTGPPNLGTFVVRAYAATSGVQSGQAETELIVRRGVSLTAALPRGVRVGDEFEAGAVITVTGTQVADVDVTVTLSIEADPSPVILDQDLVQTVKTGADGTVEVTFPFTAHTIGEADLKITVEVADGAADALQVTFPVEGVQDPVIVASSFAVQGTDTAGQSGWTEGLELPDALPDSGSVDLLAGVGRLPAIQTIATVLFKNEPFFEGPYAYHTLATLTVKPILDVYGVQDTQLYNNATLKFQESLLNLTVGNLTLDEDIGLMHSIPDDDVPLDASVYLNAYGAFIGLQVLEIYEDTDGITDEQKQELARLVELWTVAAQRQIVQDAIEARTSNFPSAYYSLTNVALVRYILGEEGLTWVPEVRNDKVVEEVVQDLSLERLLDNIDNLSVEASAYLALLLLKDQDRPEVQDILDRYTSSTRVGGRTAYISYSPSSAYPVGPYDQSVALITYATSQTFNALVEKLANYLGGPLNSNGVASSYLGDQSSTLVMLALMSYDQKKGSTTPNLTLTARSGNLTLLEVVFDDASDMPVETSTPWEDLDSPPKPIDVKAEGTGEATIAAVLDFVPKNLIEFPVYRGFHVTTIVQMADPVNQAPTGPPLSKVPLGSVVSVTVQVVAPDRYSESRVRVLMPGGLEPIDPNVDSDADAPCFPWLRGFSWSGGYSWFPPWWCPLQETRPQVVTFDLTRIGPGATEFNVLAVAATRGRFVLPSVKAFVVDEPEILGLSAAGYFEVCEDCDAEVVEEGISVALECPNDCSGLGVCDVQTGTCKCNEGFVGDDCSGFAEE